MPLAAAYQRLRITVSGAVQGVGFRPFVYRLAGELGLSGWVNNSPAGVAIEVEGVHSQLAQFLTRLTSDKPPSACIQCVEPSWLDPIGFQDFRITESDQNGPKTTVILPDLAVCPDCLNELFDPNDRRFAYPFINCTNCGPRYSIVLALPYDRPNTTMSTFLQCPECLIEYEDPANRRFHAQPNACPGCGPHLELWGGSGARIAWFEEALIQAAAAIADGKIVAVKGLGGYQLMADARDERALHTLRRRKRRSEKPFAVMFPTLEQAAAECVLSDLEKSLLLSPQAPIVLVGKRDCGLAESVAPDNPDLGIMLPYTPMHHLLMASLGFPIVATSGNLSDEPICTEEHEAMERLEGIADLFLTNNRPIARQMDDSVVRVVLGRALILRRARGYAPMPILLPPPDDPPNTAAPVVIAYGAHQKATVAIVVGNQAVVSQHVGDLGTSAANHALRRAATDLPALYGLKPAIAACDLHPDYGSSTLAANSGLQVEKVQHHHAHVLSCMAENDLTGTVLGVAWDGTGLGTDGTIWGGEFLLVDGDSCERVGRLRHFALPGGDHAVREPRRSAISVLYSLYRDEAFAMRDLPTVANFLDRELDVLQKVLDRKLNAPMTTSAGRLFDAAASLTGLRQCAAYEGQGAINLEFAARRCDTERSYPVVVRERRGVEVVDWGETFIQLIADVRAGRPVPEMAALFHNALIESIVEVAKRIGKKRIVLTGGCFQSKYLTERAVMRLSAEGFCPYWHQRIPPNDGGIALGQSVAVADRVRRKQTETYDYIRCSGNP